jgi:hypothetical protein
MIKSRSVRWVGHVTCGGKKRGLYWVLVEKPEGKRLLGRPRHRWEDSMKLVPEGIGWEGMECINLARDMYK